MNVSVPHISDKHGDSADAVHSERQTAPLLKLASQVQHELLPWSGVKTPWPTVEIH